LMVLERVARCKTPARAHVKRGSRCP
jgi:hypothetical protein